MMQAGNFISRQY